MGNGGRPRYAGAAAATSYFMRILSSSSSSSRNSFAALGHQVACVGPARFQARLAAHLLGRSELGELGFSRSWRLLHTTRRWAGRAGGGAAGIAAGTGPSAREVSLGCPQSRRRWFGFRIAGDAIGKGSQRWGGSHSRGRPVRRNTCRGKPWMRGGAGWFCVGATTRT